MNQTPERHLHCFWRKTLPLPTKAPALLGAGIVLILQLLSAGCGSSAESGSTVVVPRMPELESTETAPDTVATAPSASSENSKEPAQDNSGINTADDFAYDRNSDPLGDYSDRAFAPYIKSVRVHPAGKPLDPPVYELGSTEVLEFRFDDLEASVKPYRYTLLHCNRDWRPSELEPYEYLEGFPEADVPAYELSAATLQTFVSYSGTFPSEDLRPLLSGNFLLIVWNDDIPGKPVLTRRLLVTESGISVNAETFRPAVAKYRDSHQGIRFRLGTSGFEDQSPFGRIGVSALQNFDWNSARRDWEPQFVRDAEMIYENPDQVFEAGKEWRYFSTRNLNYLSERIQKIDKTADPKEVMLVLDDPRSYLRYQYRPDMNGSWFVALDDNQQSGDRDEREADYAIVNFRLSYPAPLTDGKMGVLGRFTDGKCLELEYDFDSGLYQGAALLKQGRYDYQYARCNDELIPLERTSTEGNWFETENTYQLIVYYRDFSGNYDRIAGYSSITTSE